MAVRAASIAPSFLPTLLPGSWTAALGQSQVVAPKFPIFVALTRQRLSPHARCHARLPTVCGVRFLPISTCCCVCAGCNGSFLQQLLTISRLGLTFRAFLSLYQLERSSSEAARAFLLRYAGGSALISANAVISSSGGRRRLTFLFSRSFPLTTPCGVHHCLWQATSPDLPEYPRPRDPDPPLVAPWVGH
jgi:hypothetical protein